MSDGISFQTWICPICHDDHKQGGACTPVYDAKFSPAKDDRSYIAEEFRKLESRCAWQAEMLERAKDLLMFDDPDQQFNHEWIADLEKGPK